ncbi:hypothetical protein [Pedobacter sp. R-06]|uniref:hypothetical protein n=1 Tax=Pedobacter sp. R-06 TaxID=3404051 RepID=UPI003CE98AB8
MQKPSLNKKVCLITSGHLSSDPRLCKEALTLSQKGFDVHIIFVQNLEYLAGADQAILSNNPTWTSDKLKYPKRNVNTLIFRKIPAAISKFLSILSFNQTIFRLSAVLIKNQNFYWQVSKAIKAKADLYIGHDLGALPVIVAASKKNGATSIFDAEDFHRYEVTDEEDSKEFKITRYIEDKYILKVNLLTAASPLIAAQYAKLYNTNVTSILNVFPQVTIKEKNETEKGLKLFWFSQSIGPGRGLENIILAINKLKDSVVSITILGDLAKPDQVYFNSFFSKNNIDTAQIHFEKPILSDKLIDFTSKFDIGLATEIGIPKNRDICLTNKIFTYIQAGIAVFASDTLAQQELMDSLQNVGVVYKKDDIDDISSKLTRYLLNRNILKEHQHNALKAGRETFNWEIESKKFLSVIEQALSLR